VAGQEEFFYRNKIKNIQSSMQILRVPQFANNYRFSPHLAQGHKIFNGVWV